MLRSLVTLLFVLSNPCRAEQGSLVSSNSDPIDTVVASASAVNESSISESNISEAALDEAIFLSIHRDFQAYVCEVNFTLAANRINIHQFQNGLEQKQHQVARDYKLEAIGLVFKPLVVTMGFMSLTPHWLSRFS